MKSLDIIKEYESGNLAILKDNKWLMYLAFVKEQHINYERLISMEQLSENRLLKYVKKSLIILEEYDLEEDVFKLIQETLKWSEVAKGGMEHHRQKWLDQGHNLFAHNIGSASIYSESKEDDVDPLVDILISTHGLIGQFIRGEVPLGHSSSVIKLLEDYGLSENKLRRVLMVLNHCIIGAVSPNLWLKVRLEVESAVDQLISGADKEKPLTERSIIERVRLLRSRASSCGEDFDTCFTQVSQSLIDIGEDLTSLLEQLLTDKEIWYFEAGLNDFSFEEIIKILLITYPRINKSTVKHISFENIMKEMYYDYEGKKKVNLYSKRIVENHLSSLTFKEILSNESQINPHLNITCDSHSICKDTIFVSFDFTRPAQKLIEFCVEAEKSSVGYERAVVLLYDYFGLRKDKYDRFHNEESYLKTMNQSIDYKSIILDYIVGNRVVDIGPGGGALMDLIEENKPDMQVLGIDISSNVIDTLKKKKNQENKQWDVQFGDALNLNNDIKSGSVDTIIFCSIIHELYSYIEFEGKMFNKDVIKKVLESAYGVLAPGGRIIIRDGIMTEPEDQYRTIEFTTSQGMEFLERYAKDFKGRVIAYSKTGHKRVKMLVNDVMEFLFTYTWGEDSYAHEINEQFGYFTPSKYSRFIKEVLGNDCEIIVEKHYLQEGYTTALEPKVKVFDESGKPCQLPDSTCLIVIEKTR